MTIKTPTRSGAFCTESMYATCTALRYPGPNWALISGLVWIQNVAPRCPNTNWALGLKLAAQP